LDLKAPLLLLHGAMGASAQFDALKAMLEDTFAVYSFDFSGHGEQELHNKEFSLTLFTNDIRDFLLKNKIQKPNIFGYSMGGYVALNLAIIYPNEVSKIMTIGTKFKWTPEIAQEETKLLNPEKIKVKVPVFAEHLQKLHGNKWSDLMQQTANFMHELGAKNALPFQDLQRIKAKLLLSLGDNDKMVSLEETQAVQLSTPNSDLHIFKDTPHPWEQVNQKEIANKIKEFFAF
jgi:pimeloyl-ACP methyl ester carboxylesterase